eukprot:TRINITY_DN5987_c0_g1_i1.p2 TRINITY_DN5987_c0_g1~~TRINITY_DN5987_c0_g1_i1.p2  ORF type:complete len:114 (-),score=16.40 TRINITY_DN5987_c0_g1_i1:176-517(-)
MKKLKRSAKIAKTPPAVTREAAGSQKELHALHSLSPLWLLRHTCQTPALKATFRSWPTPQLRDTMIMSNRIELNMDVPTMIWCSRIDHGSGGLTSLETLLFMELCMLSSSFIP